MSVWLRDQNLLELLAKTASGATEQPTEPPPPWLRLQRRETVIWTGSGVHLLEARSDPRLPTIDSAYSGLEVEQLLGKFPGPLPDDVRILDKGTAVITTTRVLFAGARHRREWAYGRIRGLAHVANAPATIFRLAVPKVFGLLLPEPITVEFRFLLGLALADRARGGGHRHLLAERLGRLLAEHREARPEAPPEPRRSWRTTAIAGFAAAAAVLALLGFAWLRDNQQPEPAALTVTSVVATPTTGKTGTTPSPTPTPTPAPAPTTTKPTPTPSACGAPSNPYGYTFCEGTLVRNPDPQVCEYFSCIWDFSSGRGYLVQCEDGMVSLWGGLDGVCGRHGGVKRPVYQ